MQRIALAIDAFSRALAAVVMVVMLLLVGIMIFEVMMRHFLNAPTLWAFDVSYMLNGCIFIGASSYALLQDSHVRVTFISGQLTERTRRLIDAAFFIFLFLPTIGFLAHASVTEALEAFLDGTRERVSPWAPLIWPFYAGLAVGVCGLWLQALSETLKDLIAVFAHDEQVVSLTTALAEKD